MRMCTHTHTHRQTDRQTDRHTHTHTHTHTHMHTHTHTRIHTHAYTHTCACTHTHTHTHEDSTPCLLLGRDLGATQRFWSCWQTPWCVAKASKSNDFGAAARLDLKSTRTRIYTVYCMMFCQASSLVTPSQRPGTHLYSWVERSNCVRISCARKLHLYSSVNLRPQCPGCFHSPNATL